MYELQKAVEDRIRRECPQIKIDHLEVCELARMGDDHRWMVRVEYRESSRHRLAEEIVSLSGSRFSSPTKDQELLELMDLTTRRIIYTINEGAPEGPAIDEDLVDLLSGLL